MSNETGGPKGNDPGVCRAKDHPEYAKLFKLINVGVPLQSLREKAEFAGLDPNVLDDPDGFVNLKTADAINPPPPPTMKKKPAPPPPKKTTKAPPPPPKNKGGNKGPPPPPAKKPPPPPKKG